MSKDMEKLSEEHKEFMKNYWNGVEPAKSPAEPQPQVQRAVPRMPEKIYPGCIIPIEVPKHDPVNHPAHYTDGGIETIDFIEAKKLNYNRGNAVKYITRAGKKLNPWEQVGIEVDIQDLEKAIWYLQREVKNLKGYMSLELRKLL